MKGNPPPLLSESKGAITSRGNPLASLFPEPAGVGFFCALLLWCVIPSGCGPESDETVPDGGYDESPCEPPDREPVDHVQDTRPAGYSPGFAISELGSQIPVLTISTDGQTVKDEPRIPAVLDILAGDDQSSFKIGIELRGGYSLSSDLNKKQFGFETWNDLDKDEDVSLLGMPAESDWVLNGPYSDVTEIRNHVSYSIAAGVQAWAPRTRMVEVFLNQSDGPAVVGDYLGLFALTEKVKRGSDRVDVDENGFILEMTKQEAVWPYEKWFCGPKSERHFIVNYPRYDKISEERFDSIRTLVREFEDVLYSEGYESAASYIDEVSFADYFLLNELFRNIDSFQRSTFISKSSDGELTMGPVWDMNAALGIAGHPDVEGWCSTDRPWVAQLLQSREWTDLCRSRWQELRATVLSAGSMDELIVESSANLEAAGERNLDRWSEIRQWAFIDSPSDYPDTYSGEIDRLRAWLDERGTWMDQNIEYLGEE